MIRFSIIITFIFGYFLGTFSKKDRDSNIENLINEDMGGDKWLR